MNNLEFKIVLANLADLKVKKIEILYGGSGDDGAVEDIDLVYNNYDNNPVINNWDSIRQFIEDWTYKILEDKPDWYNGDGGGGSIIIEVPLGEYNINHFVSTKTYEDFEGNILKEMEED